MIIACFLLCIVAFYLFLAKTGIQNRILKLAISVFVAMSFLSLSFSLLLFAGIGFVIFQVCFLVAPLAYIVARLKKASHVKHIFSDFKNFPFTVLAPIVLGLCLFSCRFFTTVVRWGEWDAWAIWSQHARFLTHSDYFTNLFTDKIAWTHPDYPMMLPSLIAMVWKSFDNVSAMVPALLSYTIAISMIALVMGSFFERRFWVAGVVITLLLSATSILFPFVVSQFSDTLLACFILLPFVALHHLSHSKNAIGFILIGFLAASAAWIKNEGLMFFVLFTFCFAIRFFRHWRRIGAYLLGAVFPILVLGVFKIFFSPPGDILAAETDYWQKISDWSRYEFIFEFASEYFIQHCLLLLVLLIAVLLIHRRFYISFPFVVIGLLFLSYLAAYVISPYGLQWHMTTSFDRLVHQVAPALFYAIFFSIAQKFSKRSAPQISTDGIPIV